MNLRKLRKRISKWWAKQSKRAFEALEKRSERFRDHRYAANLRARSREWQRVVAETPVEPRTVVFESYRGRSYGCSPRALYLAMLADPAYDGWEFVWAFKRPKRYRARADFERATVVRYDSDAYYRAYARSGYWISNSRIPDQIEPRSDQRYIQTWHGTPLKRLAYDVEVTIQGARYNNEQLKRNYSADARRYTHMLSPSPYASEKLRSAFNLSELHDHDIIVEEGYPRNDCLSTFAPEDIDRVRETLGLPEGKRVVLYAPTWRDNQHAPGVGYTLELGVDFDELRRLLGDDHVILFRAHYFIANRFDFERHSGFVYNVSKHDDINELYLVSDVLVTDYSSVLFDYAILNRPMVFYMYDLDDYTQHLRGFYLDLSELPGPVVRTEAQLADALRASATPSAEQTARLEAFSARFAPHDDGHASQRVLARVIRPQDRAGTEEPTAADSGV